MEMRKINVYHQSKSYILVGFEWELGTQGQITLVTKVLMTLTFI